MTPAEIRVRRRRLQIAARMARYLCSHPNLSDWELARLCYCTTDDVRTIRNAH